MKANTIHSFTKRLLTVLAIGLITINAWGTTYTYYLNSAASGTGGANVNYWYTNSACTTHCQTSSDYKISSTTIYYKYSTEAATAFTIAAADAAYFMTGATTALLIGKSGSTMTLPTYSGEKITNVTIATSSGCSGKVTFNIYSGSTAAGGDDKTGAASKSFSFDIGSSYQSDALKIKVNNANNLQISTITITTASAGYAVTWNNGGHGTAPTSPTAATSLTLAAITGVAGYTCTGWKANVDVTNTSSSATISAGTLIPNGTGVTLSGATTFTAQWSANNYTITLNNQSATTAGTSSISATYNASTNLTGTPAITKPTKTHYDFGGYYTAVDGGGSQIIDANGDVVASVTNYTDASKNWIKADNVTLYAKWTEHSLTNYRTKCCDILDEIDGEATMTGTETTMTISAWSDVSNASSYTVRLYKWNSGTSSWGIVSGSTTGGSSGTQGTRTSIATDSKSVTWSGIEYGATYKVTVQAIGNNTTYCDGAETAIDNINSTDLTDNKITWLYSIYIDDGTQSDTGWGHHYIESLTSNAGSVDIELESDVDYYQYKLVLAGLIWYGNTGKMTSSNCTSWTFSTGSSNCKIQTSLGGDYTFGLATGTPAISVTYPTAFQDDGYKIWFDKSAVSSWGSNIYYRIGKPTHHTNNTKTGGTSWTLVPGTDDFYVTETMEYDGFEAWQIANNTAWCNDVDDNHSIYVVQPAKPSTNAYDITYATTFQKYVVGSDGITLVATSKKNTEDGCDFWNVSKSDGMLTHMATITTPSHGTITIDYTDVSGTDQSKTATTSGLAHRTVLTITATPATGYSLSALTVDGNAHTNGNDYILDDDATIAATFTAQTSTVTLKPNGGSGSDQEVLATYDAAMPLVTTADKTPAISVPSRDHYSFTGYYDNTSGGTQYYSYTSSTLASARTWDKTGSQNLYAQWLGDLYTITYKDKGDVTFSGEHVDGYPTTHRYGTATTLKSATKTGYTFDGWFDEKTCSGDALASIGASAYTDNFTLYGSWTPKTTTITLDMQSGTGGTSSVTATYDASTNLTSAITKPTRSNYVFKGYYSATSGGGVQVIDADGNWIASVSGYTGAGKIWQNENAAVTLYACWAPCYAVTWNVNGVALSGDDLGSAPTSVETGKKPGNVPPAPANNTLNNCANKFMGWSTHSWGSTSGKDDSDYDDLFTDAGDAPTISAATDFYAVFAERDGAAENTVMWSENWTGVTSGKKPSQYDGTGRTVYNGGSVTYTESGSDCNVKAESHAGGSSPELYIKGGEWWNIANIPTGGATTLTLTYMSNNDADITTTTGKVAVGTTSSSGNTRTRTITISGDVSNFDLKFAKSGNTRVDNVSVKVATASYGNYVTECASNQVRVTYDFNGGTGTACTEGVTTKTASYTVCSTTPTKDYYNFNKWNDGTSSYAAGATGYNLQDNTTFTAQWTPITYNITYELDGGTNSGSNPATYNVTTATITLQDPSKGRDRFDGWYSTYSAGVYSDQVTEIPVGSHGDITLYAKWAERHTIVFDADGTKTTIYRAEDEKMEDAVAGQGSVPDDPDAPSACSSKTFVGWSESEIDDETDTRPSDLMKSSAGTVDEDKHYYAVWATVTPTDPPATYAGTGVFEEITSMEDFETGTYYVLYGYDGESIHGALKNAGSGTAGEEAGTSMTVSTSSITNPTADIVWKLGGTTDAYTLYNQSASKYIEITTDDAKGFALNASTTTSYKVTVEDGHGFFFKTNKTGCTRGISIYTSTSFRCYTLTNAKNLRLFKLPTNTVTAYCTSCCATKVTLSQNSPENGTIAFGKTSVGTCGDKEVSLTITPAAGYQLHTYEVATGSGKVATKSVSPAISLDNNSSAVQNITLTFAEDANGAYDVTASFSLMTVTSWTWTMHDGGGAIPDPLNLYVGQTARFDVAYTPSGVDASKKTYTRNKVDAYINWSGAQQSTYSTISGRASTGDNTTAVSFTHADGPTKTVNVKVKPLPLVHFKDNVHGVEFDDVVATLTANALTNGGVDNTPTHDDFDGSTANTCEEEHLHLVGWIDGAWPAYAAYMAGTGDKPSESAIVGATGYFYLPGAEIDLVAKDGHMYYAIWAKVE